MAAPLVHLLLDRLPQPRRAAPIGEAWLSPAERERLASLQAPGRRAQFIGGRWLTRQLLIAAYGRASPSDWPLTAAANEPVRVSDAGPAAPVFLGLSHSGEHVACACGPVSLGLDIEATQRERDYLALGAAVGTATEQQRLRDLPVADRGHYFYALWTLKEAWIKAAGTGMTPGRMARLEAGPVPAADPQANAWLWEGKDFLLALVQPEDQAGLRWQGGQEQLKPAGRWRVRPLEPGS